jgi:hypothetical protein
VTIVVLGALGTALVVLPGFGARTLARRPLRDSIDELSVAIGTTVVVSTVTGVALLGLQAFSATRIAVPLVVLGVIGVPRAFRWFVPLVRRPALYVLSALSLPWVWSALRDGYPPAGLFQWYYWDLGRALTRAHGIPSYVSEYGQHVRWLPDYLVFNVITEAYHGAVPFGSDADQLSAFRIPMALLGAVAVYGMLRLWLRPWTAMTGTALVTATLAFTDKFNTFKPESFGIILGLVAVRLGVVALRRREPPLLLFAGVVVGLNLGVHAIGAVIAGALLAAALVAELVTVREMRRRETFGALALAALLAVGVAAATGIALQGRALVISDASRPARTVDDTDPTFLFLERNAGKFGEVNPPSLDEELSDNLQTPWEDFTLDSGPGILLVGLTVGGITVGLVARRRSLAQGVITTVGFAGLLAAGVVYFAVSYDTYVPRHTGLGRFVQYAPFVSALFVALAIEGVAVWLERTDAPARHRHLAVAGAAVLVLGGVALAITLTVQRYDRQNTLSPAGRDLLNHLAAEGKPGQTVLTNVGTRGIFEFWTGLEDPLEARQALIESPAFVNRSIALLEDTHRFFTATGVPRLADRLGADWIVVSPSPSLLGAGASYGSPPPGWTVPGFTAEPKQDGIVLLRRDAPITGQRFIGDAKDRTVATLLVLAAAAVVSALAWGLWRRFGRERRSPDPPQSEALVAASSSTTR